MPKIDPTFPLLVNDRDRAHLHRCGITDPTIRANQLRTEDGALVFPYRDLHGQVNCFARRRLHKPKRDRKGKLHHYEQPPDSGQRAYFPVQSLHKLRNTESLILITEGEKKTLAIAQLGYAAIGLGGVWGGCKRGSEELIDDLAAVNWHDRAAVIVFDYDPKETTRKHVRKAAERLAQALYAAGAREVYLLILPAGPGNTKQGADDFIQRQGGEAFEKLVHDAPLIKSVIGVLGVGSGGALDVRIVPMKLGKAAYHGPIGRFLRGVAPHTEATDAGILGNLLPAISSIIGPKPYVFAGGKQFARVNVVLVGPTSAGRKGTALHPVDELMTKVDEEFWKANRITGLSTGEGLINRVADHREWNELTHKYDVTPTEKRLFVVEEEFSKVLAHLRREANILSQILRESFDSGNLSKLTSKDPKQANGAHIAMAMHITPGELLDRFNHIEMANGFGNRFLWFAVKSDKIIPCPEPIPDKVYQELTTTIRKLSNCPLERVPRADASMGRWKEEYYPSLRDDLPGLAGSLMARGSAIVLRMALLYYLLDTPTQARAGGIQLEHLNAAMAIWDYCTKSVDMVFGKKTTSGSMLGDKILLLLADGPLTKAEINEHLSTKHRAESGGALLRLESEKRIQKVEGNYGGKGRPASAWKLAPK
jgi:hypothetical protein